MQVSWHARAWIAGLQLTLARWRKGRGQTTRQDKRAAATTTQISASVRPLCPVLLVLSVTAFQRDDLPYIPPTKPYEFSDLARDLVLLSRYLLKPGGRLVFFLPTVTDEYAEIDVQTMLCEGMQLVANSLQDFGAWGRRVGV